MKNFTLILAALFTLIFSSCTEEDQVTLHDFSGIYGGTSLCADSQNNADANETTLVIDKIGDLRYMLTFEDDLTFVALQNNNVLLIERQTVNQDQEFDVVTLEGTISKSATGIIMETVHTVDDEGESTCTTSMIKQ